MKCFHECEKKSAPAAARSGNVMHHDTATLWLFNTSSSEEKGQYIANELCKCIFLEIIMIQTKLGFSQCLLGNKTALFQIITWR